jgi:hypothetical protein
MDYSISPFLFDRKHSVMNRFGTKEDKAKLGVQSVTEGNASEHSDASSISSVERCPSFESQRAVGRNALSTIPTRSTGVAPHGQPNVRVMYENYQQNY